MNHENPVVMAAQNIKREYGDLVDKWSSDIFHRFARDKKMKYKEMCAYLKACEGQPMPHSGYLNLCEGLGCNPLDGIGPKGFIRLSRCLPVNKLKEDYLFLHPKKGRIDKLRLIFGKFETNGNMKVDQLQRFYDILLEDQEKKIPPEEYEEICKQFHVEPSVGINEEIFIALSRHVSVSDVHRCFVKVVRQPTNSAAHSVGAHDCFGPEAQMYDFQDAYALQISGISYPPETTGRSIRENVVKNARSRLSPDVAWRLEQLFWYFSNNSLMGFKEMQRYQQATAMTPLSKEDYLWLCDHSRSDPEKGLPLEAFFKVAGLTPAEQILIDYKAVFGSLSNSAPSPPDSHSMIPERNTPFPDLTASETQAKFQPSPSHDPPKPPTSSPSPHQPQSRNGSNVGGLNSKTMIEGPPPPKPTQILNRNPPAKRIGPKGKGKSRPAPIPLPSRSTSSKGIKNVFQTVLSLGAGGQSHKKGTERSKVMAPFEMLLWIFNRFSQNGFLTWNSVLSYHEASGSQVFSIEQFSNLSRSFHSNPRKGVDFYAFLQTVTGTTSGRIRRDFDRIRAYDKGMVPGVLTGKYANLGLYWYRDHTKKDTFKIPTPRRSEIKSETLESIYKMSSSRKRKFSSSKAEVKEYRDRLVSRHGWNQKEENDDIVFLCQRRVKKRSSESLHEGIRDEEPSSSVSRPYPLRAEINKASGRKKNTAASLYSYAQKKSCLTGSAAEIEGRDNFVKSLSMRDLPERLSSNRKMHIPAPVIKKIVKMYVEKNAVLVSSKTRIRKIEFDSPEFRLCDEALQPSRRWRPERKYKLERAAIATRKTWALQMHESKGNLFLFSAPSPQLTRVAKMGFREVSSTCIPTSQLLTVSDSLCLAANPNLPVNFRVHARVILAFAQRKDSSTYTGFLPLAHIADCVPCFLLEYSFWNS
ncbi:hypothetical protein AAMO2058_000624100 [Amorphochlora amoebiformis]|uniref:Uncharacterized protein n=1 Tax=Amorphochlora amoebiformis TaxID=1561963 RepID=A0A7S0GRY8_9EUKA